MERKRDLAMKSSSIGVSLRGLGVKEATERVTAVSRKTPLCPPLVRGEDARVPIRKLVIAVLGAAALFAGACGPTYRELRIEGQMTLLDGKYGPARSLFILAEEKRRRTPENLHDIGVCSVMLAREKFVQRNHAAAMRELDQAIASYDAAIDSHPGHLASIEGKNVALELQGQFERALKQAEWAAEFIGPSVKQYIFLADELEQRGDLDGAHLRYRQAVAMEPKSAYAHASFARFLLRCGREDLAVEELRVARSLNPRDEWVNAELAARGIGVKVAAKKGNSP